MGFGQCVRFVQRTGAFIECWPCCWSCCRTSAGLLQAASHGLLQGLLQGLCAGHHTGRTVIVQRYGARCAHHATGKRRLCRVTWLCSARPPDDGQSHWWALARQFRSPAFQWPIARRLTAIALRAVLSPEKRLRGANFNRSLRHFGHCVQVALSKEFMAETVDFRCIRPLELLTQSKSFEIQTV